VSLLISGVVSLSLFLLLLASVGAVFGFRFIVGTGLRGCSCSGEPMYEIEWFRLCFS